MLFGFARVYPNSFRHCTYRELERFRFRSIFPELIAVLFHRFPRIPDHEAHQLRVLITKSELLNKIEV